MTSIEHCILKSALGENSRLLVRLPCGRNGLADVGAVKAVHASRSVFIQNLKHAEPLG